jgi:hypothetical protein
LAQAFIRMEYTEDAAKICHMARAIGVPTLIPKPILEEMGIKL